MSRFRIRIAVMLALVVLLGPSLLAADDGARDWLERGRLSLRAGKLGAAESAFRKAVELDPGLWSGWRELATTLRRQDELDEAARIVDNLLRIEPDDPALLRDAGEIALLREQYVTAEKQLRRSVELRPEEIGTRMRLGSALEALERWSPALEQYDAILRIEPMNPSARIRRARMLERLERADLALEELERAAAGAGASDPAIEREIVRILRERGDVAYRREDYSEARVNYLAALEHAPGNPGLQANLGWVAFRTGDLELALAHWQEVAAAGNPPVSVLRGMGDAWLELGQPESAREAYERLLDETPEDPAVRLRLAEIGFRQNAPQAVRAQHLALFSIEGLGADWAPRVAEQYIRHGRTADGIRLFEETDRRSAPGAGEALARIHGALLTAAYAEQRYAEAAEQGGLALEADPTRRQVLRDLGWVYWQSRRWSEAEAVWKRYGEAYPDLAEPHGLLARLYLHQRAYPEAVTVAERETELAPDSRDARLRLVQAYSGDTQVEPALALARELALEYPDDLVAQLRYAEILTRLREPVPARDQWARVLELDPASIRARLRWIRATYESGETTRAVAEAEAVVRERPAPESILVFLTEDATIRGDDALAIRWYTQLIEDHPERSRHFIDLSRKYAEIGEPGKRLETVERGLEVHPGRLDLVLEQANALADVGRRREALEIFEVLVEEHPWNRVANRGMVNTLLGLRRYDDALAYIDRETNPFLNDQEPGLWRITALEAVGERESAVEVLRELSEVPEEVGYVPMLLYHGLSPNDYGLELSISTLETHLAALAEAGYETITLSQLEAMIDGTLRLPDQPILVTFDDARADSFEMADPLLKRYGMVATMFVPTGGIGKSDLFYASWETLEFYNDTGRWDLQAHGHLSHWAVPLDAEGNVGRFLTERAWIEEQERAETRKEFEARLEEDYRLCRELLEQHLGIRATGFAFPFNELGQLAGGSESDAAFINERLYRKYFRFGMVQDSSGYNLIRQGDDGPRLLWRLSPKREWSGDDLLIHLANREPQSRARLQLARRKLWRGQVEQARREIEELGGESPWLEPEVELALAEVALRTRRPREAQAHLDARLASGGEPVDPRTGLVRQLAWKNQPRADFRLETRRDSDTRDWRRAVAEFNLPLRAPVDLSVAGAWVDFNEDGFDPLRGWNLAAAADGVLSRKFDGRAWLRRQDLEDLESTWAGGADLRFALNRHRSWVGLTYEEIDTVPALLAETGAINGRLGYAFRDGPWQAWSQLQLREVDDGNFLTYLRGTFHRQLRKVRGLELGAGFEVADSEFFTPDYYAPLDLRAARALGRYQKVFSEGSTIGANFGAGLAEDALNDLRWVGNAGVRGTWMFRPNLGATLALRYYANPDYRAAGAELLLTWRIGGGFVGGSTAPGGREDRRVVATETPHDRPWKAAFADSMQLAP